MVLKTSLRKHDQTTPKVLVVTKDEIEYPTIPAMKDNLTEPI